jgi:choline dehydrogenase
MALRFELVSSLKDIMHSLVSLLSFLLALNGETSWAYPRDSPPWTHIHHRRDLEKSYDYVIIGGGTAGLTVADRLTEDGETTVLVIEHGGLGRQHSVQMPALSRSADG